ncbi:MULTISPECIES: P-loop NTPase fold protein [Nostocales]|uniref:KAP NTPase domain-containing protein n=4 Tax=Nostocales TaxID=1161 RepID=A0A8S9T8S1_9CYAN|nr:P-loop NTPase fold protein [Tolypothrix bouteillei]KAF3888961.1 hypothetical protein DA73_0400028375 [Tolypothrix bouteillei VB521301]
MSSTDAFALFAQARKQCPNPFKLETVVADKEVWGEVLTNLPSLNQHIDAKIYDAIYEVQQKYSNKIGISIKGDRGTGKSHVIHRIWKHIEQKGECVFAYIGPFSNPKRINSHVRFYLASSFSNQDINGVTQWQKLAAAAISTLKDTEFEERYHPYIERCNTPNDLKKYIEENLQKDKLLEFFDELTEAILEKKPNIDFHFLRAILFLVLKNKKDAQIALAWIKGEDNPEIKKVCLPEFPSEEKEEKSIWMIQQICRISEIASFPVVICFDQLDCAGTDSDCGDSPAETVAKCIDQIYFLCSNVILICCVISDTWREIEQMGSGIPDRVGQWLVTAKPPAAEQIVELVKLRLDWFYKKNNLNAHDYPDLHPFQEDQIKKIANEAAGVRSLMKWCAEQFEQIEGRRPPNPINRKKTEFLDTYNDLLNRIYIPIKDDDKLATIIACAMRMIPNGGTENVVVTEVLINNNSLHELHLTVCGYDCLHQRNVKIGVRVCETTTGNTFNAVIRRLLDYSKHGITRGCLVRSTDIPRNWKVGNQLKDQLVNQQGGEVVVLKRNEIKPLVAIQTIYEQAENYCFDKNEVINIVKELRLVADNPLICQILSAPV